MIMFEKKVSTEVLDFLEDESNARQYFEDLGLTQSDLIGKKVLDVGAGEGRFARWLRDNDITQEVFSVERYIEMIDSIERSDHMTIADAEALPFKDNEFDYVTSHASIPHMNRFNEETFYNVALSYLLEMIRVVKPGGTVCIYPITKSSNVPAISRIVPIYHKVFQYLKDTLDVDIRISKCESYEFSPTTDQVEEICTMHITKPI